MILMFYLYIVKKQYKFYVHYNACRGLFFVHCFEVRGDCMYLSIMIHDTILKRWNSTKNNNSATQINTSKSEKKSFSQNSN
jgi:hypothetical protein